MIYRERKSEKIIRGFRNHQSQFNLEHTFMPTNEYKIKNDKFSPNSSLNTLFFCFFRLSLSFKLARTLLEAKIKK